MGHSFRICVFELEQEITLLGNPEHMRYSRTLYVADVVDVVRLPMVSLPQRVKRSMVKNLLAVVALLPLQVDVTRDSPMADGDTRAAHRRVLSRASKKRIETETAAKIKWERVFVGKSCGRPQNCALWLGGERLWRVARRLPWLALAKWLAARRVSRSDVWRGRAPRGRRDVAGGPGAVAEHGGPPPRHPLPLRGRAGGGHGGGPS